MKIDRQELYKTAGTLGAAMVVAGYIRYSIQGELLLTSKILLIAGGVFVLASLGLNYRAILSYFSQRSSKLGANTLVGAVAVLGILGLLNFLGVRHHKRFDLTAEKLYTLSDQTQRVVKGLTKDVQVIRFDKRSSLDSSGLADRMTEYTNLNPRVSYQVVDPQEHPEIAKQYGVQRMGQVIVASGSHTERLDETGEQDLTSAILKVTRETVKTVCFVEGHGEKSIAAREAEGYSAVAGELKKENYEVKSVNLVSENLVPADCSVLVEGGPTKPLFPQEAAMIGKYLDGGGKAFLLIDPDTDPNLGDVFRAWNIAVGNNTVIDASGVGRMFGTGPAVPLVGEYGVHPITKSLEPKRVMTFFPLARTVSLADKTKPEPSGVELLKTSALSFAVTSLEDLKKRGGRLDPTKDTKGPLSLGVAADRKTGGQDARLVVIGDSDFASNQAVQYASNGDLFFNTINWLSQDEDLISIRPKSAKNRRVEMTDAQQKGLFWFSVALLPGLVIATGIFIWWKRR
jgi:gliding motility-associatede transport system auxiliary component